MEPYCATEVDRYPNDICPFNEAHRLHSLKHFEGHLLRCKDQYFPGVVKYLCRYNPNHIFVSAEQKSYHEPRCEGHSRRLQQLSVSELPFGSTPQLPKYQVCPYYPYHFILIAADAGLSDRYLDSHVLICPRKQKPLPKENIDPSTQLPLVPFAPSLRQIPNPALDSDLQHRLSQERLILHYNDRPFCTRVVYLSRSQLPDKHIYIDGIISSTSVQFPGLVDRAERKDHTSLLVGKLSADALDKPATNAYWAFYGMLENSPNRKLAVSYQCSSLQDRVWAVAHPSESSGFGGCLSKGELGLFALKHSEMLKTPSVLDGLQMRVDYLGSKLQEKQTECMDKDARIRDMSTQLNSRNAAQFLREAELKQELEVKQDQIQRLLAKQQSDQEAVLREFDHLIQAHEEQIAALSLQTEAQKREILQACDNRVLVMEEESRIMQRSHDEVVADMQRRLNNESLAARDYTESYEQAKLQISRLKEQLQAKSQPKAKTKKGYLPSPCVRCEAKKCQECGENDINTIFLPCGHLLYCNLCIATRKITLNVSLALRADREMCPRCNAPIKKVCMAFIPRIV